MTGLRSPLQCVLDGAAAMPDRRILTFVDVATDGSFAEQYHAYPSLLARAQGIAGALADAGMEAGDGFALIMRNHPEFVEAMIASEIAGTVFVPLDPRSRGEKLAYMLRFARCRGAILAPEVVPAVLAVKDQLPDLEWLWAIGDDGTAPPVQKLEDVVWSASPAALPPPRALEAPMQLLFTSGTTGDPKAILAPYARFASVASLEAAIGLTPDDRPYTGLSLSHANAQIITLGNALAMGLPLTISRQFTKSRLWEILAHYRCTTFNLLGGMATAIHAEAPGPWDRAHDVRYVLSAGMPAALWRNFEQRFGVEVFEFFGAAEGGLTLNPPHTGPVGSIGKPPADMICAILDEADHECPPGVQGEICFRPRQGDVAPVQYFNDPAASAAKTCGGWFRTGDIGYKDAEGWVYFCHRAGQSVRRNGDFINTSEIETLIAALPAVADIYVYGVALPHNTPGEKEVVAAIVAAPGEPIDPLAIFAHCGEQLGSIAVPSYIQFLSEIPKTASEKPQDRHLIAMLGQPDCLVFDRNGRIEINSSVGEKA